MQDWPIFRFLKTALVLFQQGGQEICFQRFIGSWNAMGLILCFIKGMQ